MVLQDIWGYSKCCYRAEQYLAKHGSLQEAEQEIEEFVRQWVISELINSYGYSPDRISIERKLGFGEVDIVVVNNQYRPILIVETKRCGVRQDEFAQAGAQLRNYLASAPPGTVGMITDGSRPPKLIRKGIGNSFTDIEEIPSIRKPLSVNNASKGYWKDVLAYVEFYEKRQQNTISYGAKPL